MTTIGAVACEGRPDQVTIIDEDTTIRYICRFGPDNVTTASVAEAQAERSEACLGISRGECASSNLPGPGSTECEDPAYNVLLNTCVATLFECFFPMGQCTTNGSVFEFANGARVETTPGFKYYGPADPTPCVVGETDGLGTFVFVGRRDDESSP